MAAGDVTGERAAFVVVDLRSQSSAVAQHVQGWEKSAVLDWLSHHGEVSRILMPHVGEAYSFRSACGLEAGFLFDQNGKLLLVGDHTVNRP